ncbi:MAG: hypothetical protein FWE21_02650 [Defluviitaleaceae bacterium]|nr:hypothetical protein [Defluviitaleaceae bacterium]
MIVENVLIFAKKIHKNEVDGIKNEMLEYVQWIGASPVGDFIILVRDADSDGMLTTEIILRVDQPVPYTPQFAFHSTFVINGCIMSKFMGHFI